MLPVFSSIRAKAQMSVTMNGLLVGLDRCAENLQRFCRPVAFYNDGYAHELSLAGSSFLFRHRGRHLLLCCRHQMTNHERQPNELVIIVETGKGGHVALTPNEVSQAITELPVDPDYADILLAEYHPRQPERDLSPHFLRIDMDASEPLGAQDSHLIVAIGYPSRFTDYDTEFTDDGDIGDVAIALRWAKVYLQPAERTAWDSPDLTPLELHKDHSAAIGDPDGFSGSPVFAVRGGTIHEQARLDFVGMIVRGNALGRFNMLDVTHIRRAVALHIASER